MSALSLLLALLLLACGDSPTSPPADDQLNGQVLFSYRNTKLPDFDYHTIPAQEVLYWTFERGDFSFRREIVTDHPGSRLPAEKSTVYWTHGKYWLEECKGRTCTYVFESIDGESFDYREMQMVANDHSIFTLTFIFGELGVKVEDSVYHCATIRDLPQIESGEWNDLPDIH